MKRLTMTIAAAMGLWAACAAAQSLNSNNAWGVNPSNNIYHLTPGGWTLVAGPTGATMVQVSVSPNGVLWGLDKDGGIWTAHTMGWQKVQGNLKQISAGSSSISSGSSNTFGGGSANTWGVNSSGSIYQWNGSGWMLIANNFAATPAQVSVGADGTVFALDQQDNIYSYTGGGTWKTIPGALKQVSVGNASNVWGVNSSHTIYQWNGSGWAVISGPNPAPAGSNPVSVSVGADGTVYMVDNLFNIFVQSGTGWTTLPGKLTQISAALSDCLTYEDPTVTRTGAWVPVINGAALAGGYLQSANPGDKITLSFSGDSVALFRLMDPNGGMAGITVDGKAQGTFDFYFSQTRWQVPAVLDHLGAGPHTLVLTVLDPADKNPASAGNNIYIDTFGAPAPFLLTSNQQSALSRINYYRGLVGMSQGTPNQVNYPLADRSIALNLAAQAHVVYTDVNNSGGHFEDPTLPNYIGADPISRFGYFGYASNGSEDAWPATGGANAVDNVMNSVYHRSPIMTYYFTDFGLGFGKDNYSVLDFGQALRTPRLQNRVVVNYPANGQLNVPTTFGAGESPSPLPAGVNLAGYPLSVHITQPDNVQPGTSTAATTYSLTLASDTNTQIPVYPVTNAGKDNFYMLAQKPLTAGTTYNAGISGTDSQGNLFQAAWSFTTIPSATVVGSFSGLYPTNAFVTWGTAGPVVSYQLVYGAGLDANGNPTYGTQAARITKEDPTLFTAFIFGLAANTTYHYQITTVDDKGITFTSPDATFTTTYAIPNQ